MDPKGLYIQPIYAAEMMSSNAPDMNDYYFLGLFNLNAFKVWGTEIGYYKGAISYGLQLKYGTSIHPFDLNTEDVISGEIVYNHYYNASLMSRGRIIGTKTKSNFQLRMSLRAALGFYYYQGKEYIENDTYANGKIVSRNEYVGGVEVGLDIVIGFRPTPASAILLSFEPLNVQLNSIPGALLGFGRIGLNFQL